MLTVDFINVGYGDAVLIRDSQADFSMLVDCGDITVGDGGPGSARISAAEFLRRESIRDLDLLVLTHLHRDHSGGLTELLKTVRVKAFWTNYLPSPAFWGESFPVPDTFSAGARCLLESMNIYLDALRTMGAQGTVIKQMDEHYALHPLTPNLQAEIHLEDAALHRRQAEIWQDVLAGRPDNTALNELDGFINNTSIRMRLYCGGKTVELPGDVYANCWEQHQLSPCTIVKLPHHGHRDSVTPKLLEMLQPEHVVISVSNSRTDDCPSKAVLQAVEKLGSPLHITDAVPLAGNAPVSHASVHFEF